MARYSDNIGTKAFMESLFETGISKYDDAKAISQLICRENNETERVDAVDALAYIMSTERMKQMPDNQQLYRAKEVLKLFQKSCMGEALTDDEQCQIIHSDVVHAFLIWWKSKPSMTEFQKIMNCCTVFAEFAYIMSTERWD
jgi:hypothetical protein